MSSKHNQVTAREVLYVLYKKITLTENDLKAKTVDKKEMGQVCNFECQL